MVQVYASNITERLKYAVKLVLHEVCLLDYTIVSDKTQLDKNLPVINYSGEIIEDSLQIHPKGLLYEKNIQQFDVDFSYGGNDRVKLFVTEFDDLGFDIFSASFFLATRFEEYWKFEADQHGRYTSGNSLAKKLGFLQLPLINIWCENLKNILQDKFSVARTNREFKIINTIDVDNAWAFKNKSFVVTGGAIGKSITKMKLGEFSRRSRVLMGNEKDPYDTYDYIKKKQEENNVESIYFFLLGNRNTYDKNVSHKSPELRKLIRSIADFAEVGIHPSYASYLNEKLLQTEVTRLAEITGKEVMLCRKHFLKLSIPETYRNLESVGVKHDYTMGYADHYGFRASICTPYTFFDVLQNKELDVTVHPFSYMDGTLNEYMELSVEEAISIVQSLKEEVKAVNGEFIAVWHNETLNDEGIWKGWKEVYEVSLNK